MATENATTWLDIMPAILLVRGVPVVTSGAEPKRGLCMGLHDGWNIVRWDHKPQPLDLIQHGRCPTHWLSVDLDDPQGFGYALRWYANHDPEPDGSAEQVIQWAELWLQAEGITDEDRTGLAFACAVVVRR